MMEILDICIGQPTAVEFEGKDFETAIFKQPIDGPVFVSELNIDGDRQANLDVHGGRDKAVYVYSADYASDWAEEIGVPELDASQFGQNLTISGGRDNEVTIGARYRIGEVQAVVTQPRIPCSKLGVRMNDATFPNRFWNAGRLGFYMRVEKEGKIDRGDRFELVDAPAHGITVRTLYEIVTGAFNRAAEAIEVLEHIDPGWQRRLRLAMKREASTG